jgi:acyl-coenzyme A synthetase/AMP-(fatty) acid ligase
MGHTIHHPPADCGRRLIPQLVDEIAHRDPQRPFISVPRSSNISDGYKDVDYKVFSRAVNRCAWFLEKELGCGRETQTIFYMGSLDLRYLIVLLAAVKIGHRVC